LCKATEADVALWWIEPNCQLKVKPLLNAKLSLKEVLEIGIFPLLPACFVLIGKCSQI